MRVYGMKFFSPPLCSTTVSSNRTFVILPRHIKYMCSCYSFGWFFCWLGSLEVCVFVRGVEVSTGSGLGCWNVIVSWRFFLAPLLLLQNKSKSPSNRKYLRYRTLVSIYTSCVAYLPFPVHIHTTDLYLLGVLSCQAAPTLFKVLKWREANA